MNKFPLGINSKILINNLREIGWEASDLLLYYSRVINELGNKDKPEVTGSNWDPVTIADLKVNELVITRIEKNLEISIGIF